jgi:hypothetical protein
LFPSLQPVEVAFNAGEEVGDFGLDFGEQGCLSCLEVGFGDEFEVLCSN